MTEGKSCGGGPLGGAGVRVRLGWLARLLAWGGEQKGEPQYRMWRAGGVNRSACGAVGGHEPAAARWRQLGEHVDRTTLAGRAVRAGPAAGVRWLGSCGMGRIVRCRRVGFIPKPGTGERRPLSIPAVRDRIVQAAVKIVLEPVFEADMAECSFASLLDCSPASTRCEATSGSNAATTRTACSSPPANPTCPTRVPPAPCTRRSTRPASASCCHRAAKTRIVHQQTPPPVAGLRVVRVGLRVREHPGLDRLGAAPLQFAKSNRGSTVSSGCSFCCRSRFPVNGAVGRVPGAYLGRASSA